MNTERFIRITNLCMLFYRAEGIAFSLYDADGICQLQYPVAPDRNTQSLFQTSVRDCALDIISSPSHAAYAKMLLNGGWQIIIGPVYNGRISATTVQSYMEECAIPSTQKNAASSILEAAPNVSLLEFFDKAAYLYYCVDGEILDPAIYFDFDGGQRESVRWL